MYPYVLQAHSWLRWVVLLLALMAIVRAIGGTRHRRSWIPADDRAGRLFIGALDLQLVIGLVLYFVLSPITQAALSDFGGAMKASGSRYWAVEHVFGMVIGVALAHIGWARAKRFSDGSRKHKTIAIFFVLALVAVLVSIPWPGTPNARPLFR